MSRTLAVLVLTLACAFRAVGAMLPYEERERAVWTALINHGLDGESKSLVLSDRSSGDPAGLAADPAAAAQLVKQLEVPASAFDDWKRRNARVDELDLSLKLDITYQVITAKNLKTLFADVEPAQGWQAFFNRYAGAPGFLRLSHVGFDDALGHALVYVEHECGAECGAGRMLHLVLKPGGGWEMRSGVTVWMAK